MQLEMMREPSIYAKLCKISTLVQETLKSSGFLMRIILFRLKKILTKTFMLLTFMTKQVKVRNCNCNFLTKPLIFDIS